MKGLGLANANTQMLNPRYIDDREHESRRVPLEQAGFLCKRLVTGDVQWPVAGDKLALLENKPLGQFLQDFASGVLTNQCQRMREACDFPILMIEGHWRHQGGKLLDTQYTWEQVWNQLQTLQDMGLRIQLTTDPVHTVERILSLAEYYSHGVHQSVDRVNAGTPEIAVLCRISGIGPKRAEALLAWAGNLRRVVTASVEELTTVRGINYHQAVAIRNFWGRQ